MSDICNAVKREVLRLAAKEARTAIAKARKATAEYRHEIAALKRLLREKDRELARVKKGQQEPVGEDPLEGVRFSARSVRAQRRRLGLTYGQYATLVGASPLSVYHWEIGMVRPRRAQLMALVAVRGISKQDAMARLGQ